jgi:hypothetical protein
MTDVVRTRVGWADFGDYAHFGKRLYRDFAGRTSFLGLAAFGLTGRVFPELDVSLLDDLAVCMHCPEPRVWPAKLARVASSNGRFAPGMVVGWAALDSAIGVRLGSGSAQLLLELAGAVASAADPDACVTALVAQRSSIPGLGVHVRPVDERVTALRECLVRRQVLDRPYWSLAEKLWTIAERDRGLRASFWSAVAAVLLDIGFGSEHVEPILGLLFQPSYLAHSFDGAALESPSLRRLPPEAVQYVGVGPRTSPRAGT